MRARIAAGVLLLLGCAGALSAESVTRVTLTSAASVSRANGEAIVGALTTGKLDVSAQANRNVRAELELDATVGEGSALTVPRAFVKVRLPWFRLMIGKTRVSFGRGFFLDAGDVIFGGGGLAVADFSAAVLRDDTTWLTELYLPLGDFSYLEGVLMPHLPPAGVFGSPAPTALVQDLSQLIVPVDWRLLSGGGRLAFRAGGTDLECGYLFSGRGGVHLPYLSAAGSLGLDWYAAASATIPASAPDWLHTADRLALSGGLFHLFDLRRGAALSGRLEFLLLPGGRWRPAPGGLTPVPLPPSEVIGQRVERASPAEVTATFASRYGLYLFPEVDYSPSESVHLLLRALVSPVDRSASLIGGAGWNVYQGLTLSGYLFSMAGADTATFGWNQPGGLGVAIGAEMIF